MKYDRGFFLAMVVAVFFSGFVFAEEPPKADFKVPAKYSEEQEVENSNVFSRPVYKREIIVEIREDWSGFIDVKRLVEPNGRGSDPMYFEVKKFKVDGDMLIVEDASPMPNNLHVLYIKGDFLETGAWERRGWRFKATALKKVL
jgi:hypothetical protein